MTHKILKDPTHYAAELLDAGVRPFEIEELLLGGGMTKNYATQVWHKAHEIERKTKAMKEKAERLAEIDNLEVGDGVTIAGYTDQKCYTIVEKIGRTQMLVQEDTAKRLHEAGDLGPMVGGFACHFAEQHKQRWEVTPNPDGAIVKITRRGNGWGQKGSKTANVRAGRNYFYDYNF